MLVWTVVAHSRDFMIQKYFVSWSRHYTYSPVLKILYVMHLCFLCILSNFCDTFRKIL